MTVEQNSMRIRESHFRLDMPQGPDLLASAIKHDAVRDLPFLLAKQLGLYKRPEERTYEDPPQVTVSDYKDAIMILSGKKELSFLIAQTVTAGIVYKVNEKNLDPNIFLEHSRTHRPTSKELEAWKLTEVDVLRTQDHPPVLAGSLLLVYYDGIDENTTFMRKVDKGPYQDRWTIRGGHYDNLREIAAFEEASEEGDINFFYDARPLGIADQIVAVEDQQGGIGLRHYHNYMWELIVGSQGFKVPPKNVNINKPWREFTDGEVVHLQQSNKLTPISECAFKANRVFL